MLQVGINDQQILVNLLSTDSFRWSDRAHRREELDRRSYQFVHHREL
jgi:hypothetical protein